MPRKSGTTGDFTETSYSFMSAHGVSAEFSHIYSMKYAEMVLQNNNFEVKDNG